MKGKTKPHTRLPFVHPIGTRTQPGMHRAFLIPDIVAAVVEEVGNSDLCTLARTCKAFTEPALDILWRDPKTGAAVLAQCMPPHLCDLRPMEDDDERNISRRADSEKILVFRESVAPRRLRDYDLGPRFAYYAKRLQRLALNAELCENRWVRKFYVDPTVLAVWSGMEHLFPRLRTIFVDGGYLAGPNSGGRDFGSFLRFSGLRTLRIFAHAPLLDAPEEFRDGIIDACSRITSLDVRHTLSADEKKWETFSGNMLAVSHRLRSLSFDRGVCIHHQPMLRIAEIPVLQHLKIVFSVDCARDVVFPTGAFVGLRTLLVDDYTPGAHHIIGILMHCASTRLEKLDVGLPCGIAIASMTALLHQIGQHTRLTYLDIDYLHPVTSSGPIERFAPFLEALKPLPLLQMLRVRGEAALPIHIGTLVQVVRLYPLLSSWRLSNRDRHHTVDEKRRWLIPVTLAGLLEILRLCPHLTSLPVIINSPDLPSEEAQAAFGIHPYRECFVEQSATTPALRHVIQRLFPQARLQ